MQVITNVSPYQSQLLNRFTRGMMLVAGQTMLVIECTPAAYINLAANEAEKAAAVNLMHVTSVGVFGRLWMAGTESDILAAATPRSPGWRASMAGRSAGPARRRRFITRHDVEDAAAAGQPIRVRGRDVLTDEAAQRAGDLGWPSSVRAPAAAGPRRGPPRAHPRRPRRPPLRRPAGPRTRRPTTCGVPSGRPWSPSSAAPPGLDAAIDRVLQRRPR